MDRVDPVFQAAFESIVPSVMSLDLAKEYLAKPYPVFLAHRVGAIAACNVSAPWLGGVESASELIRKNFFAILADLVTTKRILYACDRVFLEKKSLLLGKLAPHELGNAHALFRQAIEWAAAQPDAKICPIKSSKNKHNHERIPRKNRNKFHYPLYIYESIEVSSPKPLEFVVVDSVLGDDDRWFLISCVPANDDVQLVIDSSLKGPEGGNPGPPVFMAGETLEQAMYNTEMRISLERETQDKGQLEIDKRNRGDTPDTPTDNKQNESAQDRIELGMSLRYLRERRGLETKEVASLIGVTPGALNHWELGRRKFNARERLVSLMDALGASPDERRKLATLAGYAEDLGTKFQSRDEVLRWMDERLNHVAELQSSIATLQNRIVVLQTELGETLSQVRAVSGQPVISSAYDSRSNMDDELPVAGAIYERNPLESDNS